MLKLHTIVNNALTTPVISPFLTMPYFERASEFDIQGGQFTDIEISGNVYVGGQHTDPDQGAKFYYHTSLIPSDLKQLSADSSRKMPP